MEDDTPSHRRGWTIAATLAGIVAAVASTWPLATALTAAVPTSQWNCLARGCEDEILCVWIVTALGQRLAEAPAALFEGGILLPLRHTLAFSETMLSAVAATAPIAWLTGSFVLAYDLHYLAGVALSVLGTFLLVRHVTGDPRAALVAGLLFGLAGERWQDRGHLAKVSVHWVPFVLWTWVRFLDRPGAARALALAAALLANLHSGVYHGLALPVLLVPWAAVLAGARLWPWRRWLAGGAIAAAALAAGLVLYWPFAVVRQELSFTTSGFAEVPGGWSWYVGALGHPLAYLERLATPDRRIVGMTPLPFLALAVAALATATRASRTSARAGERAHAVAIAAFALFTAAVTIDPDRLGTLGRLLELPFSLPGLDGLRGRSRFAILVTFGGSVLLGIAFASVLRRVRPGAPAALVTAVAALAVVVDTRTLHEPTPLTWLPRAADLPPALTLATQADPRGGLLHLPYGQWAKETLYMTWALHHRRPLLNGYTAVMPRFGPIVRTLPEPRAQHALVEAGITQVIVHESLMRPEVAAALLKRLRSAPELRDVTLGDATLFTLHGASAPAPPLEGEPLPRDGWRLEGSDPDAARAADGDLATHWTAATLDRPTFLRVDLGQPRHVTGLRLAFGPHVREYPHAWEVWGSLTDVTWTRLGGERPTTPPFASYGRDHRAVVLELPFDESDVRYVELRVPAQPPIALFDAHGDGRWGVHELDVVGR